MGLGLGNGLMWIIWCKRQGRPYKKNSKRMGINECGRPKCPKPLLRVLAMSYNSKPTCSHMIPQEHTQLPIPFLSLSSSHQNTLDYSFFSLLLLLLLSKFNEYSNPHLGPSSTSSSSIKWEHLGFTIIIPMFPTWKIIVCCWLCTFLNALTLDSHVGFSNIMIFFYFSQGWWIEF